MNTDEFAKLYLWQLADAEALHSFYQHIGGTAAPSAKKDDPDFYFESKKFLLNLHFVDEDYLLKRDVPSYGQAAMRLVSAEIPIATATSKRQPLIALPFDVHTISNREQLLAVMPKAADKTFELKGSVRNDQWFFPDYRLVCIYKPVDLSLKSIQIISQHY